MLKKKLYAIKKVSAPLPASTLVSSFSWWAVCWSSAGPFRATPTVIGRIFLAPAPSCWPLASACWSSTGSLPAKKMKNFPSTLAARWHQPKLPSRWLRLPTRLTGWYRMNINSSPSSKRHLVMCPTRWNWSMKWHQFTNLIVTTNRTKSIIIRLPIHERPGSPPSSDPSTISFSIYLSKKMLSQQTYHIFDINYQVPHYFFDWMPRQWHHCRRSHAFLPFMVWIKHPSQFTGNVMFQVFGEKYEVWKLFPPSIRHFSFIAGLLYLTSNLFYDYHHCGLSFSFISYSNVILNISITYVLVFCLEK